MSGKPSGFREGGRAKEFGIGQRYNVSDNGMVATTTRPGCDREKGRNEKRKRVEGGKREMNEGLNSR